MRQLPARPCLQVLRKQREKDAELARVRAEREAEAALRALERKLQLQDKVRRRGGARCLPRGQRVHLYITCWVASSPNISPDRCICYWPGWATHNLCA